MLSVICGVVAGSESLDRECHHVNFVAASKSGIALNQLFFAELNYSYPGEQEKTNFCCPLPMIYTGKSTFLPSRTEGEAGEQPFRFKTLEGTARALVSVFH